MSQPAKSMSFAPRARWRSSSGVVWTGWSTISVIGVRAAGRRPSDRRSRLPPAGTPRRARLAEPLGGPRDEGPLRLEGQDAGGVGEREPADLVELVVVVGQVAPDRLHQEVVDGLVDPRAALDERVVDRVERLRDPDREAGLLADLAEGRLLDRLAGLGRALRAGSRSAV